MSCEVYDDESAHRLLLQWGADPTNLSMPYTGDLTIFHLAAEKCNLPMLKWLVTHGLHYMIQEVDNEYGWSVLLWLLDYGNSVEETTPIAHWLVDQGADVGGVTRHAETEDSPESVLRASVVTTDITFVRRVTKVLYPDDDYVESVATRNLFKHAYENSLASTHERIGILQHLILIGVPVHTINPSWDLYDITHYDLVEWLNEMCNQHFTYTFWIHKRGFDTTADHSNISERSNLRKIAGIYEAQLLIKEYIGVRTGKYISRLYQARNVITCIST